MSTEVTDTTADRDNRLDHSDLTDAERGELETGDASAAADTGADDAAGAAASGDGADAGAAAAAAATSDDDDRQTVRSALETATRAADLAARALEATTKPAPAADTVETVTPRDYDAELKALKAQYDAGDIDRDAYDEQRDAVRDARADFLVEQRVSQRLQQHDTQSRQATWEQTYGHFLSHADNQRLTGPALNAAFNAAIQASFQANPNQSFDELLAGARKQVFDEVGIVQATPVPKPTAEQVRKAVDQRRPQDTERPADIGSLPRAGADTAAAGEEQLDALPIEDLEDWLARNPGKADAYLAGAPGGLRDHPRDVA